MLRRRRGACPPFIAIGLALTFAILSLLYALLPTALAATSGEELPPPGGQWPSGAGGDIQIEPPPDTSQEPGEVVIQEPDPDVSENPVSSEEPSASVYIPSETEEPAIVEDPVGRYPSRLDMEGIKIVSPTLDQLLAPGADLESLLYPSGLKLPTKYMDLLMCSPTNSSTNVVGETANFLKTAAPNSTGIYTFAEYEAADIYLAICRCYLQEEGASLTGDALKNLDTNTTVNWTENVTNATISDYSKLVALITNYKSILESYGSGNSIGSHAQFRDLVAEHKSVYYSLGSLDYYKSLADGTAPNDRLLSVYTNSLYSTWTYLGVVHNITPNLVQYSKYYNEFAYNGVNYNRGAPVSSFSPADPDAQASPQGGLSGPEGEQGGGTTQVTAPDHGNGSGSGIISGSTGNQWENPNTQGSGDTPVSSVGSSQGVDNSVLPNGRQNILDIASKIALGFVVIGVIIVWVIHTHRKGSDPLSKWK